MIIIDVFKKMRKKLVEAWMIVFLIIPIVMIGASSFATLIHSESTSAYYYSPDPVTLVGVIKTVVFAGPPNYLSIKEGDQPESVQVLTLHRPISVLKKKGSQGDFEDSYRNINQIQLVVHSDRHIKTIENKNVRVSGTFFSSHTGHHHTDVLMEVTRIEEIQ